LNIFVSSKTKQKNITIVSIHSNKSHKRHENWKTSKEWQNENEKEKEISERIIIRQSKISLENVNQKIKKIKKTQTKLLKNKYISKVKWVKRTKATE